MLAEPRDASPRMAILARLAESWPHRASVRKFAVEEPEYDPDLPDYPVNRLPFATDLRFAEADEKVRSAALTWGWIAYNSTTIAIEEHIVNPAFNAIVSGELSGDVSHRVHRAILQARIDETYHTLLHADARSRTIQLRGIKYTRDSLPIPYTVRRLRELQQMASTPRESTMMLLAFATVTEVSFNNYLELLAKDQTIQPAHSYVANLHNRDEYCHASVMAETVKDVYRTLNSQDRAYFARAIKQGLEAFAAHDFSTWDTIFDLVNLPCGRAMLRDCVDQLPGARFVFDYSEMRRLSLELGLGWDYD
jgi:alpha-N-dichloroacetyl-p-aminophenylserinol N-oxygenase